jgi:glycosyltransferase involved in cell wall biosynthesis
MCSLGPVCSQTGGSSPFSTSVVNESPALELTVLMPCLNEARTLPQCIRKAIDCMQRLGVRGEVLVADNGSTDGSRALAEAAGARVLLVKRRGYGAALAAGVAAAKGRYVVMGDSDDSYDFSKLDAFVERLRAGDDLVMGNRFRGGIAPAAMPLSHRYFGNPLLSAVGRRFFHNDVCGDFYCGLRGFRREAVLQLGLQSPGMEYALEMIIKAGMNGLRISEVPTTLSPDGRDRAPHLRTYRDGWRSLRLYLLMSPRWFFAVPGATLFVIGAVLTLLLLSGPLAIGNVHLDYHTLLYSSAAVVLGYQALIMAAIAKLIATETGLHPPVTRLRFLEERGALERLLMIGGLLAFAGVALGAYALFGWSQSGFGNLSPTTTIRYVAGSILLLLVGGQTALAGGFLGLVNLLAEKRAWSAARQTEESDAAVAVPVTPRTQSA